MRLARLALREWPDAEGARSNDLGAPPVDDASAMATDTPPLFDRGGAQLRKRRWVTLGYHYDWTERTYSGEIIFG